MFDLDELIRRCTDAIQESEPQLAVRDVLDWALATPGDTAAAFGEPQAGITVLHRSPDLTVLNIVWPPQITLFPHDHRMWAAIGIYGGREDNTFYRRAARTLVESGGRQLSEGDVLLLGDDAVHGVANPERAYTGAIHVYGGDFIDEPRSQWPPETLVEEPYDLDVVMATFDEAERAYRSSLPG